MKKLETGQMELFVGGKEDQNKSVSGLEVAATIGCSILTIVEIGFLASATPVGLFLGVFFILGGVGCAIFGIAEGADSIRSISTWF